MDACLLIPDVCCRNPTQPVYSPPYLHTGLKIGPTQKAFPRKNLLLKHPFSQEILPSCLLLVWVCEVEAQFVKGFLPLQVASPDIR